MGKKRVFFITVWIIAILSFGVEKFYLEGYLSKKKLENYTQKSGELLDSIDKQLSGLVSSGQLNYLLWTQGHLSDELAIVKAIHPLIKDVMVYSRDFHLLAGSSDHYSESKLVELLENSRKKGEVVRQIQKSGYFHIYPVENGKKTGGYIVAVLGIPRFLNEGCAYIMDISRNNLYCNTEDYLSSNDTDVLSQMLLKTAIGSEGKSGVKTAVPKDIYWNFYQNRRVYFGFIVDQKPLYEYVYVYIAVISVFISFLLLLTGTRPKQDKYEAYEKIIENNLKTLNEMKKGMDLLLKEPSREKIIEIESARQLSEAESDEFVTGFYHRPESATGETGISDFIFLDPLDTKWYKPLKKRYKLPERYAEYGKEAFSDELMSLMREVAGEEGTESGTSEETPDQEDYRVIQKDPLASALERLYNSDEMGEELEIGIEYVKKYGRADGIAVMFFNQHAGCYMIEMSSGLEPSWNRYFYVLSNDTILPVSPRGSTNMIISEKEIQDPFFRKRIPPEFIGRMAAIKLLPVSVEHILVRVALIYFNDSPFFMEKREEFESALIALDTPRFFSYLKETLPAFGKSYIDKERAMTNADEPYRDIYNILKSFTMISEREVLIVHVVFQNVLDFRIREDIKEKSKSLLIGNERLIINNPNHLIFLIDKTSPESVKNMINELKVEFEINTLRYPELGKNLFAYI